MSNGEMLDVLRQYTEQGKEIPDELYKSLALASHVDMNAKIALVTEEVASVKSDFVNINASLENLCRDIEQPAKCTQSITNKDEIDRLRNRGAITDVVIAIVSALALLVSALTA